jgi:outer membrane protein assembly factor BamE
MAKFFTAGKKMRIKILLMSLAFTFTLSQCASYDFARRISQQGNLLTPSKLQRLRVGMSKDDVAVLMGTSLLSPIFNNNRWDYAYTWRRGNNSMEKRHVSLYFSNGVLARIERKP